MESKKINQLATSVSPQTSDLTIIGDPVTGVSKKITLLQIANLFATTGTVTSVAVTETGDALTITGSPITSAGTINIGFAGDATQYVRGDGALADFPTSTGGGSSVSYYLNSSVSQGTIGGVAYRELSKDPISGAGTDITISADGYIASYITDANDPALLEVPGGNFNCEFYFSVNSNAHNPYVYAELYKYDGSTFTLLGSSQSVPEYLTNGTTLSPYYFAIPVATAALTITDRLAIRIYANVDTRTVTLHTENNHLCQVVTTFSKGLISLNNLTRQNQFFGTGTSGTDFGIVSSVATHTFNLPVASAANTGKLSSTDWSTFNGKQPAGNYVTLDTTQTITAAKTFSNIVTIETANYLTSRLKLNNTATGGNSWSLSSGNQNNSTNNGLFTIINETLSKNTFVLSPTGKLAIGADLGSTNPADAFSVYDTNTILKVVDLTGNNSNVNLQATNTAAYLRAGYTTTAIPLIIQTGNTDRLTISANGDAITLASNVTTTGAQFVQNGFYLSNANAGALAGYTLMFGADDGIYFGLRNITGGARFIFQSATSYNYTFPAAAGTLALTSNLSAYLPLAGGTLTGALSGTSATFSGNGLFGGSTNAGNAGGFTLSVGVPGTTAGGIQLWAATNQSSFLQFGDSTTSADNYRGYVGYNHATDTLSLGTASADKLTIASTGAATFTSSVSGHSLTIQNTNSGYYSTSDYLDNAGTEKLIVGYANSGTGALASKAIIYGTSGVALNFYTNGSTTAKMVIDTSGNVGIGTSSPLYNLHVAKSTSENAFIGVGQGSANGDRQLRIGFGGNGSHTYASIQGTRYNTADDVNIVMQSGGGNVGIGVTPSAWGSIFSGGVLQVKNSSLLGYNNNTYLTTNAYFTNSGDNYIGNGFASRYIQTSGNHVWENAPNNTSGADAVLTLQERMRITSGGNVQIGGTTGSDSRLYIKGVSATSSNNALLIHNSSGTDLFYVRNDGLIQTGTAAASPYNNTTGGSGNVLVDSGGNLYRATSSLKYKKNVQDYTKGLAEVMQLRPVTYEGKSEADKGKIFGGLIAEEVHDLGLTEFVVYAEDGTPDALAYSNMVSLLVKAIQEQQAQIEELKALINK